jgi:hypothetical protein
MSSNLRKLCEEIKKGFKEKNVAEFNMYRQINFRGIIRTWVVTIRT